MPGQPKRLLGLIVGTLLLQSCYTLLHPPETLPQTMTTVVTEQAMASSLGGAGVYGWDPYWEPALPFSSYHRGYGASYYSPYNYYDYQHPYYAPVYVVSENTDPAPARDFGRDDLQGGGRNRNLNSATVSSGTSGAGSGSSSSGGMSTAAPVISQPPVVTPQPPVRIHPRGAQEVRAGKANRETKPIRQKSVKPPKKNSDKGGAGQETSKKRLRTRK